jgi:RimJ/RimL family protein N-acetyltransferase
MDPVFVRDAIPEDLFFVFELRNKPETYKFFEARNEITLEEHKKWFMKNFREFKIIETAQRVRVGYLRFQPYTNIAIALYKEEWGKGYGSESLKFLPEGNYIAKIHHENEASFRVFQKAGFQPVKNFQYFELIRRF